MSPVLGERARRRETAACFQMLLLHGDLREGTAQVSSEGQAAVICPFCRFPEPIKLATDTSPVSGLSVDAQNVYWGDWNGNINSVPTGGRRPRHHARRSGGQGEISNIAPVSGSSARRSR